MIISLLLFLEAFYPFIFFHDEENEAKEI